MIKVTNNLPSAIGFISITGDDIQDGKVLAYYAEPMSYCSQLLLSQAGTTSVNGNYSVVGIYNGYNFYTKDGNQNSYPRIRFNQENNYWEIVGSTPFVGATLYYTTNLGPCPASLEWETAFGLPDPPTFSIIN